jgi:hypothetical protein
MEMNPYAINAYAAWCYEQQQLAAYNAWCYEQHQHLAAIIEADRAKLVEVQNAISRRMNELRAAEAEGARIKEQYRLELEAERAHIDKCRREQEEAAELDEDFEAVLKEAEQARLAYAKELYNNEKIQELAQCRIYREEDKFERLLDWQQKRAEKRRMSRKERAADKVKARAAASEQRHFIKNYAQEVFDKAQLDISLGKGQVFGERGRYSIPRTKRPMGSSFGWNKSPRQTW